MLRFFTSVVVALTVLLVACGSDSDDTDGATASPTTDGATATATQPLPSPTATTEASPEASPSTTPAANAGEPYELVASWGEPALLVEPADVAVLPDGGLIVADQMRGRLVHLDQDGNVVDWWEAGGGRALVAVDGAGAIYAQASQTPGLVKLDADGNTLATLDLGTRAVRFQITDLAADDAGYAYAASGESRSSSSTPAPFRGVHVFDPSGAPLEEWAAPLAYHPQAIAAGPDGTIYVSAVVKDANNNVAEDDILVRIERGAYHPNDWIESRIELPDGITTIDGLATTPDGRLYVFQATNQHSSDPTVATVFKLDQSGAVTAEWTIPDFAGSPYAGANGIVAAPDGGLYLADEYNHRVLKMDGEGNVLAQYSGDRPGTLAVPTAIDIAPDGELYILDNALHLAQWFTPDGKHLGSVALPGEYRGVDPVFPPDIAVGAGGMIWISQSMPPQVAAIMLPGEVVQTWDMLTLDQGNLQPPQFQPDSIALTADDTVLLAFGRGPVIFEYTSTGELLNQWQLSEDVGRQFLTVTVSGTERYALATLVDDTGNRSSVEVQRLLDDGTVEVVASIPLRGDSDNAPELVLIDIAVDLDGNIYLADLLNRQIIKLAPDGAELARWQLEGDVDRTGAPISLAVASNGHVYVADAELQRISVYAPVG